MKIATHTQQSKKNNRKFHSARNFCDIAVLSGICSKVLRRVCKIQQCFSNLQCELSDSHLRNVNYSREYLSEKCVREFE